MNPTYSRYFTFIKPVLRNKQVRTYSVLVFSLLAVIIFSVFAIKPTVETILSLQKSINEQQQILNRLNDKAQNLTLGRQNLDKIDPNTVDRLNNLLPSKTDPTFLADSLTALALQNNASISGLLYQPVTLVGIPQKLNKAASLQEIDFTFNVAGDYNSLMTLLSSLKQNPRLVSINSLNLNQVPGGPLVMSINAKAFFLQN